MCLLAKPASLNPCLKSSNSTLFTKLPAPRRLNLRPPNRRRCVLACSSSSEPSVFSEFITSVGSPSPPNFPQWSFTQQHLLSLNFVACTAAAVSATWLFCAAIPTLLAFKKAAESLEKLLNVTREELPGTMAAIRLSGMEISDLTMELSDLGQEINKGVTSSTRAVRVAEERLRRLTNMSPSAPMQGIISVETKKAGPVVARTARGIRECIVKGRGLLQMFLTLTKFSGMVLNFWKSRAKV